MYKKRNYKKMALTTLCVSVFLICIAYISLSRSLEVTEDSVVNRNLVYINNLSDAIETGSASNMDNDSTKISEDKILVTDIVLRTPGDTITYEFNINNDSNTDLMIKRNTFRIQGANYQSLTNNSEDIACIKDSVLFNVLDKNGYVVDHLDTIKSHSSKLIKFQILYNYDATCRVDADVIISGVSLKVDL